MTLGASLPEDRNRARFRNVVLIYNTGRQNQKKRRLCQLTLVMLCSHFCLHMMIWWGRPWFGSAWSSSEQSGLTWSHLLLHMQN